MRADIAWTLHPSLSRRTRNGLALALLLWIALVARFLFHSIHRVRNGEPIYAHLVFNILVVCYLIYLFLKILSLPPSER